MQTTINLSVIIVSWNVRELLLQTLESIFKVNTNITYEVIIVDNASVDGSVEAVKKYYPQVKILANKVNLGFATACWQGVEKAQADYFLFLNDDTKIMPNSLDVMYQTLLQHSNYGVVGGKILNPDNTIQPSVRTFPTVKVFFILLLKLHRIFPRILTDYLSQDFDYEKTATVNQVMGAFFATSREVWQRLDGFDKNFFIWFEEVDYCVRVQQLGLEVHYQPAAQIIHYRGASFKQLLALPEQIMFNRSLYYYAKKHFSKIEYYFLKIFQPISLFLAFIVQFLERKK